MNSSLNKLFSGLKSKTAGMPPGTLVSSDDKEKVQDKKPLITLIDYDENDLTENTIENISALSSFKSTGTLTWINVSSLSDIDTLKQIGDIFNIHSLTLEDILNTNGRPKIEEFTDSLFARLKMIYFAGDSKEIITEQVSLVLGKNYLITFQEFEGDVFGQIRDRLRSARGRIRKKGADYLFYAIADAIVDNYYLIPESLAEDLEGLEDKLLTDPEPADLQLIHRVKSDLILLRRAIWPLREMINSLLRGEFTLIEESNFIFVRDLYDHAVQVVDTIETFRDIVSGLVDTYMTSVSNRMNEVMKVLTIIATIFIPITFIAGIYGMNFQYMPELAWKGSYFVVWGIIIIIAGVMIAYFKKKNWF